MEISQKGPSEIAVCVASLGCPEHEQSIVPFSSAIKHPLPAAQVQLYVWFSGILPLLLSASPCFASTRPFIRNSPVC